MPAADIWRFARFLMARVASSLSFQMLSVAVGWQIYAQTHSPFALGMVGLCLFLPMVLLTLLVGHLADRFDRRRIVAACQAIEALSAAALALCLSMHRLSVPMVYLLIVVGGSARAFESPTIATLTPSLVPRSHLPRATAWATSSGQLAQIAGPALGGLLYVLHPAGAFAACAMLFLCAALLTIMLPLARRPASKTPVSLASLFSGFHFIRSRPVILGTISLDLFAVLLGGATALLPIFAGHILKTGPSGLGLLRSAPAIGALVMSIVLARVSLKGPIGHILFGSLLVFGAATIVFALSTSIPLSLVALAILGAADSVSVVVRTTLVQLQTPDEMLGRVSAVNMLFVGTSNQLGEFESGTTAALLGAVPAAALGGIGTIVVSLLWMKLFPALLQMRSLDGEPSRPPNADDVGATPDATAPAGRLPPRGNPAQTHVVHAARRDEGR